MPRALFTEEDFAAVVDVLSDMEHVQHPLGPFPAQSGLVPDPSLSVGQHAQVLVIHHAQLARHRPPYPALEGNGPEESRQIFGKIARRSGMRVGRRKRKKTMTIPGARAHDVGTWCESGSLGYLACRAKATRVSYNVYP